MYRKIEVDKKKSRGNSGSDIYYYIGPKDIASSLERLNIFHIILNSILTECESNVQKRFLASKYVNFLIKICGLSSVYKILKKYMGTEFRRIGSHALLSQPALIEEYKKFPQLLKEEAAIDYGITMYLDQGGRDFMSILQDLDPIIAVRFYRTNIKDSFSQLYREFDGKYESDGLKEFADYDVLLSPFTSYPLNDPAYLLLLKPFERIYADAYIFNEIDYMDFIKRAYIVFSNFAEILSNGIDYLSLHEIDQLDQKILDIERYEDMTDEYLRRDDSLHKEYIDFRWEYLHNIKNHIEIPVKLSIYYWNIASRRFDLLKGYLSEGKHHIFSDNGSIQIIDLKTGELLLNKHESMEIMSNISLLSGPDDPFLEIWPCNAFYELELNPEAITYSEILEKVKSSLRA